MHKWSSAVHFVSKDEFTEQNVGKGEKNTWPKVCDPHKKMKREGERLLKSMLKDDCKGRKRGKKEKSAWYVESLVRPYCSHLKV